MNPSKASQELARICPPSPEKTSQVLAELKPPPRTLGLQTTLRLRSFRNTFFVLIHVLLAAALVFLFRLFNETDSDLCWIVAIVGVFPAYFYCLYAVFVTYRKRISNFTRAKSVYEKGIAAPCEINTLTFYSNGDYDNLYVSTPGWLGKRFGFVRVDYTFVVKDKCFVGSNFLRYRTARELHINDLLTVIYDPDNPAESLLYPIPPMEFCLALEV